MHGDGVLVARRRRIGGRREPDTERQKERGAG
jgi:hypothetical protein